MKELIYKKGLLLKIVSWENDGDNYRTKEYSVDSKEEALAIKRMCEVLFKSEHESKLAIANDCGASINTYSKEIIEFMSNDKYFKKFKEDDMVTYVEELNYELMGGSEYYNCRVCESCIIYDVKKDVYLDIVQVK